MEKWKINQPQCPGPQNMITDNKIKLDMLSMSVYFENKEKKYFYFHCAV